MFKWLFDWFGYDVPSKPEEGVSGSSQYQQEPVQVKVDVEMPDFLKETSAENPVDTVKQDSPTEKINDDEDIVIEKPAEISDSLLDNKPLVKVFAECADLLNELDRISPRFSSPDSQLLIEIINERLRSALYLSGGVPIEGDTSFDPIRHICPENPLAKEGSPICETLESGVELDTRVFVKAKVKLTDS